VNFFSNTYGMGSGASLNGNGGTIDAEKRNGDDAFKVKMYSEAIYWYTQALLSHVDKCKIYLKKSFTSTV